MSERTWLTRWGAGLGGVALVLTGAACSSGSDVTTASSTTAPATSAPTTTEEPDNGEAEVEAFCDAAAEHLDLLGSDSSLDPSDDEDFGAVVEALNDVTQYVPDDLYDDWEEVRSTMSDLYELDASERTDALIELIGDEDFTDAQDAVDEYMDDNCGFTFSAEEDTGDTTVGSTRPGDEDIGVGDDDFGTDDDPISTDALQAYLDQEYGSEPWVEEINGWGIVTFGDTAEVSVSTSEDWSSREAIAACEAVSEWLFGLTDEGSVSVTQDDLEIARRTSVDAECEAPV